MKKLIFPTDFSDAANRAFKVALRMTAQMNGELYVLHSLNTAQQYVSLSLSSTGDPTMPGMEPEVLMETIKQQKDSAQAKMELVEARAEEIGVSVQTEISEGDFQDDILDYASKWNIDYIVMGTNGAEGFQEAIVGSNAQMVVRKSRIPVLTIHDSFDEFDVRKIVFASDFSEDNVNQRIPEIKELSDLFKAELHLLMVNTPAYFEETKDSLQRMKDVANEYNVLESKSYVYNDFNIDEGVIHYSEMINADLIILVTHGFKGLKKLLSDNVTESVVNHSNIPVLSFHTQE